MVRMFWSMPLATICETCSKLMVLGSKHKSSAPLSGYSAVAQKEAAGYSYDLLGRLALPLLCNSQKYQPPWNNRWLKINIGMSFRLYFTWHVKFAQVSQELRAIKSVGRKKNIKTYLKKTERDYVTYVTMSFNHVQSASHIRCGKATSGHNLTKLQRLSEPHEAPPGQDFPLLVRSFYNPSIHHVTYWPSYRML